MPRQELAAPDALIAGEAQPGLTQSPPARGATQPPTAASVDPGSVQMAPGSDGLASQARMGEPVAGTGLPPGEAPMQLARRAIQRRGTGRTAPPAAERSGYAAPELPLVSPHSRSGSTAGVTPAVGPHSAGEPHHPAPTGDSAPFVGDLVQRQPAPPELGPAAGPGPSPSGQVVQRADEPIVLGSEPAAEGSGTDLAELARRIYPIVKRLLAIERERRVGRWR
ncbi:MAG: hypothetical protein JXA09_07920 [Anaerolineae bacterium]|nr:hypothetical protein [Anaerolineae bacterium]